MVLVNGVGMQRRFRFACVNAEGTGDALCPSGHVPLAIAGPLGGVGRLVVVDDRHVCPHANAILYSKSARLIRLRAGDENAVTGSLTLSRIAKFLQVWL